MRHVKWLANQRGTSDIKKKITSIWNKLKKIFNNNTNETENDKFLNLRGLVFWEVQYSLRLEFLSR